MAVSPQTIAVAMSGGIDSTMAVLLLQRAGHEVFGVTALLAPDFDPSPAVAAAARLGIQHEIVDLRAAFDDQILEHFASEYVVGRTPSPCGRCNPLIKFGKLMESALSLGAEAMATGHYVRRVPDARGTVHLYRGVDETKDQTYFLFGLAQAQVQQARFPLGGYCKSEIRALAAEAGVAVAGQGESQDLCFVSDGNHTDWLADRLEHLPPPGDIVDSDEQVVGRHRGLHVYTRGQRKGLGVALGFPAYVSALEVARNRVHVGPRAEAEQRQCTVDGMNWIAGPPEMPWHGVVQVRYHHRAAPAEVSSIGEARVGVCFDAPQFAVTPGQIAVFYDGDELLGGGWIE